MSRSQPPGPPPAALRDFPIWQGVTEAYRRSFTRLSYFPVAAALPVVLTLVLNVFSIRMAINAMTAPQDANPILILILILLSNCPYILFSVAWFRLVLLGEARARPAFFSGWQLRHWRFLRFIFAMLGITMFAVMAATLVMSFLLSFFYGADVLAGEASIGGGVFLLAILVSLFITIMVLRFCFVFPAAAVDETYGLAMSWQHTKGQALRIFLAILLVAFPFAIATSILGGFLSPPVEITGVEGGGVDALPSVSFGPMYLVLEAIFVIMGYLMTAVCIELVALAFRICTGWVPDDAAGPPVPSHEEAPS